MGIILKKFVPLKICVLPVPLIQLYFDSLSVIALAPEKTFALDSSHQGYNLEILLAKKNKLGVHYPTISKLIRFLSCSMFLKCIICSLSFLKKNNKPQFIAQSHLLNRLCKKELLIEAVVQKVGGLVHSSCSQSSKVILSNIVSFSRSVWGFMWKNRSWLFSASILWVRVWLGECRLLL